MVVSPECQYDIPFCDLITIAVPWPATEGFHEKNLFSLKDDNNYICLLIHYMYTLISSEMEISNSGLLLTKLPLSVKEHLLTITRKIGKMNLFSIYICSSDVYTLKVMPGV